MYDQTLAALKAAAQAAHDEGCTAVYIVVVQTILDLFPGTDAASIPGGGVNP